MKAEFELSLDDQGKPCIKFKNFEKDNSLDQTVLKSFVYFAMQKGINLVSPGGYLNTNGDSFENYEIRLNP